MGWGAHLSCLPRVRSEDIDQLFGRLASWIARHHRLENLDQFVQCIQRFLNTLEGHPWPSQQHRLAFPLTAMHDWMAWLEGCGMTLKGHTGPSAPHLFCFRCRGSCEGALADLVEHPHCLAGEATHPSDTVLFVKQWMASDSYSQPPMVVLRAQRAAEGALSITTETRPMTAKYKAHVLRFCPILRAKPYYYEKAATYLEGWVNGTLVADPVLDVSACVRKLTIQQCGWHGLVRAEGDEADGLEPLPGVVSLVRGTRKQLVAAGHGVDAKASFVYTCATTLFVHHGVGLAEAVAMGEKCWEQLAANPKWGLSAPGAGRPQPACARPEVFAQDVDVDAPAPVLDLERHGGALDLEE